MLTKQRNDYTGRFPCIVTAVASLKVKSITLDGEAMCFTNGKEDFDKLWNGSRDAVLCAFDLLESNGVDYRQEPLLKRKDRLRKILSGRIEFVDHLAGNGAQIFAHACAMGLEGIVSKRVDAPYKPGPSKHWVKTKNRECPAMIRVREAFHRGPVGEVGKGPRLVLNPSPAKPLHRLSPMAEQRHDPRRRILMAGTISFGHAAGIDCIVRNLPDSGAFLTVENPIGIPDRIALRIPVDNMMRAARVV